MVENVSYMVTVPNYREEILLIKARTPKKAD